MQDIVDNSLTEDSEIVTIYELREQAIIEHIKECLKFCEGRVQKSCHPNEYITRVKVYKELLELYGVDLV